MMQENLSEKLNKARLLKKHFKLEETVTVLKECLELDPSCLIASAQAGFCLLLLGKAEEAEPFLTKTFDASEPKDLPVGAYLAACLTAQGKSEEAGKVLSVIQNDTFSAAETYMLVAEMLSEKKLDEQSVRLLDALAVHFSKDPFFAKPINHYRVIRILAHAGLQDIAAPLVETLIKNAPDSWETSAAKASVAIAEGNYDKAYTLTVLALKNGGASYPLLAAQQHWLAMNK